MFGIDGTILAFIVLAGFSAGAVAYAFLFNTIETEKKAGKRLETVKRADTDRSVVKAARDRTAEAAKRRKSVQDSLKELDAKQKAKDLNVKKPPLRVQLRQAGIVERVDVAGDIGRVVLQLVAGAAGCGEDQRGGNERRCETGQIRHDKPSSAGSWGGQAARLTRQHEPRIAGHQISCALGTVESATFRKLSGVTPSQTRIGAEM